METRHDEADADRDTANIPTSTSTNQRRSNNCQLPRGYKIICIFALIDVLLCVQVFILSGEKDMECSVLSYPQASQENFTTVPEQLKILMHKSTLTGSGKPSIMDVLSRLGYSKGRTDDWDLLWSRLYLFDPVVKKRFPELTRLINVKNMPSNSKVNHFPGISFMLDKRLLLTSTQSNRYIPKTFEMPKEKTQFLDLMKIPRHKNRLWIEKAQRHKGKVKQVKDINLDQSILVQELISKQILLHDHAFKTSVHVLFTSIEPLRFYVIPYEFDHVLTPEKFSLDDLNDTRKYFTDGHKENKKVHTLPEMSRHNKAGYTDGQMVASYLMDAGLDVSTIHGQIYDAIRSIVYSRRDIIQQIYQEMYAGSKSSFSSNFFELMRWDFILGDNLQIYLLEVNPAPQMTFRGAGIPSTMKNERHLYNAMRTLGVDKIGGHTAKGNWLRDSDVLVSASICYKSTCESCTSQECLLCRHCLPDDHVTMLKESLGQHLNRQGMRRLHPKPMMNGGGSVKEYDTRREYIPKREQLNTDWMEEKCKQDTYWCS
ncbi:probable tubulin polyglutamylase ttll-15 [Amphiura filiformis]|uniref:probable tubulin polyglutamylase ttll-15 n=1 Tax=Amphiura filiformis TaxID=82378 RepID=UPI003B21E719